MKPYDKDKVRQRLKEIQQDKALSKIMDDFCTAYCIQKGVDFDHVELCHYVESGGKRSVIYFRVNKNFKPRSDNDDA